MFAEISSGCAQQKNRTFTESQLSKSNLSFRYILFYEEKTPNDAVTPERWSQFTPKMKANAVPRLLSSLV